MKALVASVVAVGALLVVDAAPARADVRVHVGGSIRVSGHVRIGHRRPRRVRPVIIATPPPSYYYVDQSAPPCGCECYSTCGAPLQGSVIAAAPAPAPARRTYLGLGLRASSLEVGDGAMRADGFGVIGRIRFRQLELELDLGKDEFVDSNRIDTRVGGALILPLMRGSLQPYLVVGGGANRIERDGYEPITQMYMEAGGGLALRLSERFTIAGDVRWAARHDTNQDDYHLQTAGYPGSKERTTEARVAGILYF